MLVLDQGPEEKEPRHSSVNWISKAEQNGLLRALPASVAAIVFPRVVTTSVAPGVFV